MVAANSKVGTDNDLVLLRLADDGTPDADFGIDGATVSDAGRRSVAGGVVVAVGAVVRSWWAARAPAAATSRRCSGTRTTARPAPIPTEGLVLDGFGGLHGWSAAASARPTAIAGNPYWPGWDIARGVAVLPGSRGIVVDAYGGEPRVHLRRRRGHRARSRTARRTGPGWDIVRGVAVAAERHRRVRARRLRRAPPVLDRLRRRCRRRRAARPTGTACDIARGIALLPDGHGGYVVDAWGGLHRFGGAPAPNAGGPYWPGQDMVRGIALSPDGSGGWLLDRSGGLHPFGTGGDAPPPATVGGPYWPGAALARGVAALP